MHRVHEDAELWYHDGEDGRHHLPVFSKIELAQEYRGSDPLCEQCDCVPIPAIPLFAWLLEQVKHNFPAVFLDLSPTTLLGQQFETESLLNDFRAHRLN